MAAGRSAGPARGGEGNGGAGCTCSISNYCERVLDNQPGSTFAPGGTVVNLEMS